MFCFFLIFRSFCYESATFNGILYSKLDEKSFGVGNSEQKAAIFDRNQNIRIDSKINFNGKPFEVTEVLPYAFYYCSHIYSIVLPDTIKKIGKFAFFGCITLESINIPNSVTEIGESCFAQCSTLNYIQFSSSLKEIGQKAFESCSSLRFVILPTNLSQIGKNAFSSCSELVLITYNGSNLIEESIFGGSTNENKLQIYVTCDYHSNSFGRVPITNPCTGNNKKLVLINRVMAIFVGCFTIGVMLLFKYMN